MTASNSNPRGFTGCPTGLIVAGNANNNIINVYNSNGNFQQSLDYPKSSLLSVDCTSNYLVALDNSNNLWINGYIDLNKLAAWIIAIIVVFSVLFCGGIALVIFCCCRRRRLVLQVSLDTTGK